MKATVFIVLLIATVVCGDDFVTNNSSHLQQAIGADLNLRMMMVEDGTPKGKCYCSCSLNNQPVFMEIDPSTLPVNEMMMPLKLTNFHNLRMMMVEDGTPRGKCYCSCSLNNQPVFMEIDPSTLPVNEMMMPL